MWHLVLVIFLWILALGAGLLLVVLLGPTRMSISWDSTQKSPPALVHFSWFNARVMAGWVNPVSKEFSCTVLGHWRWPAPADTVPTPEPDRSVTAAPVSESDTEKAAHAPELEKRLPENTNEYCQDTPDEFKLPAESLARDRSPLLETGSTEPAIPTSPDSAPFYPPSSKTNPDQEGLPADTTETDPAGNSETTPPPGSPTKTKQGWWQKVKQNRWYFIMRQKVIYPKTIRWLKRVAVTALRLIRFEMLRVTVRANLGDPARTGMVGGYIMSAEKLLTAGKCTTIALTFVPVFDRECFESAGTLTIRSSLWRIIAPLVVAFVAFPWLTAGLLWWRSNLYVKSFRADTSTE